MPVTPIFLIIIVTKKAEVKDEITTYNLSHTPTHRSEHHTIIGTEVLMSKAFISVCGQ